MNGDELESFVGVVVLVRVSITVVKHHDQKQCREEMYFILKLSGDIPSVGVGGNGEEWRLNAKTQGRNLEVETEAETMEEYCVLACSSWFAQFCFLKPFRTTCPCYHHQWAGPSPSITN